MADSSSDLENKPTGLKIKIFSGQGVRMGGVESQISSRTQEQETVEAFDL
jgi:hypothetical protein